MLGSEWLYGAIALLVGVHVLTLLYAYRRQGEPTSGTTPDAEGVVDAETMGSDDDDGPDVVACGNCGAINEGGYQFCQECVSDLSAGETGHYTATTPDAN